MTSPQEVHAALEQIKASLPGLPRDFQPQRAAAMQMYTVEEALTWMVNVATAANNTSRLPIATTCSREPDGSLTIRVVPAGSPD